MAVASAIIMRLSRRRTPSTVSSTSEGLRLRLVAENSHRLLSRRHRTHGGGRGLSTPVIHLASPHIQTQTHAHNPGQRYTYCLNHTSPCVCDTDRMLDSHVGGTAAPAVGAGAGETGTSCRSHLYLHTLANIDQSRDLDLQGQWSSFITPCTKQWTHCDGTNYGEKEKTGGKAPDREIN